TPPFYELPVVAGTDTYEFFKNHAEIGPFLQVPRSGNSISSDLTEFFAKWNPQNNSYLAKIEQSEKLPADAVEPSKDEARELITLNAVDECNKLIATRHFRRAARIAVRYGFVSKVSSALLTNESKQFKDADGNQAPVLAQGNNPESAGQDAFDSGNVADGSSGSAPSLQGATNGTIGPQGCDASVVMGVNTAGTVRVNNLANLEAFLNIIANLGELAALIAGFGLMLHGIMKRSVLMLGEDIELGPAGRVVLGIMIMVLGLAVPGVLNWFVASARDANLFS
ncbi:MAG: hypothetical protein K2X27_05870, partial [Candidatus Obscuribacterales bacterium]|nr:hypothetical protein [Candidatus Obscuribacterales bacterium]